MAAATHRPSGLNARPVYRTCWAGGDPDRLRPPGRVPDLDHAVLAGRRRGDRPSGRNARLVTPAACPRRVRQLPVRRGVPDPDGLVEAPRGQELAVGAVGDGLDHAPALGARACRPLCRLRRPRSSTTPSLPAEARRRPSGRKARPLTLTTCPGKLADLLAGRRRPRAGWPCPGARRPWRGAGRRG